MQISSARGMCYLSPVSLFWKVRQFNDIHNVHCSIVSSGHMNSNLDVCSFEFFESTSSSCHRDKLETLPFIILL